MDIGKSDACSRLAIWCRFRGCHAQLSLNGSQLLRLHSLPGIRDLEAQVPMRIYAPGNLKPAP